MPTLLNIDVDKQNFQEEHVLKKLAICAWTLTTFVGPVRAEESGGFYYESTEELLDQCSLFFKDKAESKSKSGRCVEYIEAIADLHDCVSLGAGFVYDVPNGTSAYQLVVAVSKWLVKNPQAIQYSAMSNIRIALHESFPCR